MKRIAQLVSFIAVAAIADVSFAQTRTGVSVEQITPAGLALIDTRVSVDPRIPTRLHFGTNGTPVLLVDIAITRSAADARTVLADAERAISDELSTGESIGDLAYTGPRIALFVRENVFVGIRVLADATLAPELARSIDAVLLERDQTPALHARSHISVPQSNRDPVTVTFEGPVLATNVVINAGGYARRTADGFTVTRYDATTIEGIAVIVDSFLRRVEIPFRR